MCLPSIYPVCSSIMQLFRDHEQPVNIGLTPATFITSHCTPHIPSSYPHHTLSLHLLIILLHHTPLSPLATPPHHAPPSLCPLSPHSPHLLTMFHPHHASTFTTPPHHAPSLHLYHTRSPSPLHPYHTSHHALHPCYACTPLATLTMLPILHSCHTPSPPLPHLLTMSPFSTLTTHPHHTPSSSSPRPSFYP